MLWLCRDKRISYGKGKILVMGVLNVTPDSFSDGGKWLDPEKAVQHAIDMECDGADIIDIGAQSTRPNSTLVTPLEEWERLEPVLTAVREKTDLPISVDTFYPSVAYRAIGAGADIINDVSGSFNPEMAQIIRDSGAGWVATFNGSGGTDEVRGFFATFSDRCTLYGIEPRQICFDMGIGFGKTYEQDMELIANVADYKWNKYPLLLGASRKRVIGVTTGQDDPVERVYGNISADTVAVLGGVDIIRVHDVKNEKQGIVMAQELKKWTRSQ